MSRLTKVKWREHYRVILAGSLVFVVLVFVLLTSNTHEVQASTTTTTHNLQMLRLMDDAPIAARQYRVASKIVTDYRINHIRPYYFSPSSATLTKLPERAFVQSNFLDLSFQHTPSKNEYIVLHITYGPAFVFNRESEGVCMAKFEAGQLFKEIACNTTTTAEYLVAHSLLDDQAADVINYPALLKLIDVKQLPKIDSFQNYLGLLTILQGHLAETPNYTTVSTRGNFLPSLISFAHTMRDEFLTRRRLSVDVFEQALQEIDRSMISMAYRLYMSLDTLIKRHSDQLPSLASRNTYMSEFLSGFTPLGLHDPKAYEVTNFGMYKRKIRFLRWPWMSSVTIQAGGETFDVTEQTFSFDDTHNHAFIRPMTDTLRFPVQKIALNSTLSTQDLEIATTERLDKIIEQIMNQDLPESAPLIDEEDDNAPQ